MSEVKQITEEYLKDIETENTEAAAKDKKDNATVFMETTEKSFGGAVDPYLDKLYNSSIRCPYCKYRIVKYSTTCPRCGIHKKQIAGSTNAAAKEILKNKTSEKIFMSRRRPKDVSLVRMLLLLLVGFLGTHCFYVGRKARGWFFLACTILWLAVAPWFPPDGAARHFFDQGEGGLNMIFPADWPIIIALVLWAYDIIAVLFGFFAYPIRLAPMENKKEEKKDLVKDFVNAKEKSTEVV